jgi:hypothetical protein
MVSLHLLSITIIMPINSYSRIPLDVAVKAQCLYVVKVLCLQREGSLLDQGSIVGTIIIDTI